MVRILKPLLLMLLISSCNINWRGNPTPIPVSAPVPTDSAKAQTLKVETPLISPASGLVGQGSSITITCATVGAEIYYTLGDGTQDAPDEVSGTLYDPSDKPIVNASTVIKVIGIKAGYISSDVAIAEYAVIPDRVANPEISPASGEVERATSISISCATAGADIYYNLGDGTQADPDESSTLYDDNNKPVVGRSIVIKARAYHTGFSASDVVSASYAITSVFAGGAFTQYIGASASVTSVIRLNGTNGLIDTSFMPALGANAAVTSLMPLNDGSGKIMIGGNFTEYDGFPVDHLARINADGSLDHSFVVDAAFVPCDSWVCVQYYGPTISAISIQSSGKIVVSGVFKTSKLGVTERNNLVRFNTDGTLDATFNATGSGTNDFTPIIKQMGNGDMLIGGEFTAYNGVSINCLVKIDSEGNFINAFQSHIEGSNRVRAIAIQGTKVIVGGWISASSPTKYYNYLVRLDGTTGTVDESFNDNGPDRGIYTIVIDNHQKLLIGGGVTNYQGHNVGYVLRTDADGYYDASFNNSANCGPNTTGADDAVYKIAVLNDDKIIIGAYLLHYDGVKHAHVGRLDGNGCIDQTFDPSGDGVNANVTSLVLQDDGNILLGGTFDNSVNNIHLSKLYNNGSLDTSLISRTGTNGNINSMALQSDGKLIIGGAFTSYRDTPVSSLARLDTYGNIDTSFNESGGEVGGFTGGAAAVRAIELDGGTGMYIGGGFTTYLDMTNAAPISHAAGNIAHLTSDGSFDSDFSFSTNGQIRAIKRQANGDILVGGSFTSCSDSSGTVACHSLARVTSAGLIDRTFTGSVPTVVYSIDLQGDGKILIGADGTGAVSPAIRRLEIDGSNDATFNQGIVVTVGVKFIVYKVLVQSDQRILVAGTFTSSDGTINNIARLTSTGAIDPTFNVGSGTSGWLYSMALESDGSILIGGSLSSVNGVTRRSIARLHSDGSLDSTFLNETDGFNGSVYSIIASH
ncbi:MAG: chitobiase/beta-hexosaminidase C-terminal domain-containing protein [bacterium]